MIAHLSMTAADHTRFGSTPPQVLKDNPGKTLAETMSDSELFAFIDAQVKSVREALGEVQAGNEEKRRLFTCLRDHFLVPNIRYLKQIGRLPEAFKSENFEQELTG